MIIIKGESQKKIKKIGEYSNWPLKWYSLRVTVNGNALKRTFHSSKQDQRVFIDLAMGARSDYYSVGKFTMKKKHTKTLLRSAKFTISLIMTLYRLHL